MKKAKDTSNKNTTGKPSTQKQKTLRESVKHSALDPALNLKSRSELIDYDYIHKLSPEEKAWLNKFTEEYVVASFEKNNKKNLSKTKAEKRDSYARNNARNRCALTRQKAKSRLMYLEELVSVTGNNTPEDLLATQIDMRKRGFLNEDNIVIKKAKRTAKKD